MIQSITISDCVGPYSQCVLKGDILQVLIMQNVWDMKAWKCI